MKERIQKGKKKKNCFRPEEKAREVKDAEDTRLGGDARLKTLRHASK